MKWMKMNVAQLGLVAVSLVAVIGSVWVIFDGTKFPQRFEVEVIPQELRDRQLPESHVSEIEKAANMFEQEKLWDVNKIGRGREVPIFKSVPVIQKKRQLFVLTDPNSEPIRPPFPNEYLLRHGLNYERDDVARLDPDGDGFSNFEEFHAGTDPKDGTSHPPVTDKLRVSQIIEIPYGIEYKSNAGDLFVLRESPSGKGSGVVRAGEKVFGDRFEIVGVNDNRRLLVVDQLDGAKIALKRGEMKSLPSYEVEFHFAWKGERKFRAKPGEIFRLSGQEEQFKLLRLSGGRAAIAPCDSEGRVIRDEIEIPLLKTDKLPEEKTSSAVFL